MSSGRGAIRRGQLPAVVATASVTVLLGCGLGLVAVTGGDYTRPEVLIPLALYGATAAAGSAISAPGYVRLIRLAERAGPDAPEVRRRLLPLAWVNRA